VPAVQIATRPLLVTRPALLGFAALTVGACRQAPTGLPAPAYGTATCATCGAVIGEARFAAQFQAADGAVRSFDDPACLFEAMRAESAAPRAIRFRDHERDAWIEPHAVWFARTPATAAHGSGWAAYASFGAAQEAVTAAGSGDILSFDQASAQLRRAAVP
jgi:hypothetical protein